MTLATSITQTGAEIVCKPLPAVEADPVLLELLFQNLIANALQYRRPGEAPLVEISVGRSGELWRFAGCGTVPRFTLPVAQELTSTVQSSTAA
jgi:light-regulated signal transduction histidine kinase (bacteriophytochrome)